MTPEQKETIQGLIKGFQIEIAEVVGVSGTLRFVPDFEAPEQMEVHTLFEHMCSTWTIPLEVVASKSRKRDLCIMRYILWKAARHYRPDVSYKRLGEMLNRGDHTAPMYGIEKFKDHMDVQDPLFMRYLTPVKHFFGNE